MWAFGEVLNASWQIYGNFIYYANKTPEVEKCMQQKNSSMLVTMFLLLVLGCVHFILYFFLVLIVIYIKWRRVNSTRSRRHDTARVMKSISRVKFSEELFGAVSEENECVICMSAFSANDMYSKLECQANTITTRPALRAGSSRGAPSARCAVSQLMMRQWSIKQMREVSRFRT